MSEIIEAIEEVIGAPSCPTGIWTMSGWLVRTNKQAIRVLIDDQSRCCEGWGYLVSEDDPSSYVGAELRGVSVVDEALRKYEAIDWGPDCGGAMFVNLDTSRGTLQFAVYNGHNGYYGHDVLIESEQTGAVGACL